MTAQELMDYRPAVAQDTYGQWFVLLPTTYGHYRAEAKSERHAKRIRTGWRNGVMDFFHGVPVRPFNNMQSAEQSAYGAAQGLAEQSNTQKEVTHVNEDG